MELTLASRRQITNAQVAWWPKASRSELKLCGQFLSIITARRFQIAVPFRRLSCPNL